MPGAIFKPRGQILVLFAMLLTILIGMSAFVIDIAWIWSHELRVQRAADAAALAGVVHLPGNVPNAVSASHAESRKNGYQDGVSGVDVNPSQDATDPRRMLVSVSAPVDTFFMRLFGIGQVTVTRNAKAEFVLPVPMGSPQNYYGVGEWRRIAPGTVGNSGLKQPTVSTTPNGWTNPNNAFTSNDLRATNNTGAQQGYRDFSLNVPAGYSILGIEVELEARSTDAAGCQIGVSLSWNAGTSWTTEKVQNLTAADPAPPLPILGGAADLWSRAWTQSQLSNANFRVRVRDVDPDGAAGGCVNTATTELDRVQARVTHQAPGSDQVQTVNAPGWAGGGPLATQGFWGAVFTKGGVRQNGDRYAPANYSGGSSGTNPDYNPNGYDYTIEVGAGGGTVGLFDATFCAVGPNLTGGWYGSGDHWTSRPNPPGGTGTGPVTTRYRLYNINGTEYNISDDTLVPGADSGTLFANEYQVDTTGQYGSNNQGAVGAVSCSTTPGGAFHHQWWQLASGVPAGKYRLNVYTSDPANNTVAAENLFSIHVIGGPQPRVYGGGRMAAYTNLAAGIQTFYLAQIEGVHAGKTLDITLFDPGDVQGPAYLRILSPDGNSYDYATFDYTSDAECDGSSDACSATGRTQIRTNSGGSSAFDNSVLQISISLPPSYGSGGLTPPGETEPGWWRIEYEVAGGNDTTTWEVAIRGNPVRLVVP